METLECVLCGGMIFASVFSAHLLHDHGAVYGQEFITRAAQYQQQFSSLPLVSLAGPDLQQPPATEREDVVITDNEDCTVVPSPPLLPEEDNELVEVVEESQSGMADSGVEQFQCELCSGTMKNDKRNIWQHMRNVHGLKNGWNHYLKVLRGEEPLLHCETSSCKICGRDVKYLKSHVKKCHKSLTIENYEAQFGAVGPMAVKEIARKEIKMDPSRGKPRLSDLKDKGVKKCSVCDICFVNRNLLIVHCAAVHRMKIRDGNRTLIDPGNFETGLLAEPVPAAQIADTASLAAPKHFSDIKQRSLPLAAVFNKKKRRRRTKWPCEKCKEKFETQYDLVQHKLECKGRKVKCPSCGKKYANKVCLDKHRQWVCKKASSSPASCIPDRLLSRESEQVRN